MWSAGCHTAVPHRDWPQHTPSGMGDWDEMGNTYDMSQATCTMYVEWSRTMFSLGTMVVCLPRMQGCGFKSHR